MRGAALLLLLAAPAAAQSVPPLTGRVVDTADMLSAGAAERIGARLADAEARTGAQVALVTVASLDGGDLEALATRTFRAMQLGRDGRDDGVLLLILRDDRRVRIEVGYGLEGVLTDARAATIVRETIAPRFRLGDVDAGAEAGIDEILAAIGSDEPRQAVPVVADYERPASDEAQWAALLLILAALGFVVYAVEPGLAGPLGTLLAAGVGLVAGIVIATALLMATQRPESYGAIPAVTLAAALAHALRERSAGPRRAARRRLGRRRRAAKRREEAVAVRRRYRRDSDAVGASNSTAWHRTGSRDDSGWWDLLDVVVSVGSSGGSSSSSRGRSSRGSSRGSSGSFRGGGGSSGGGGASGGW